MSLICLTGSFCSGKSYIINCLSTRYSFLKADNIVDKLYKREDVVSSIQKSLLSLSGDVCKSKISQYLIKNPGEICLLEKILHPYVCQEIDFFNFKNKNITSFVEVPFTYTPFYYPFSAYIIVYSSFFLRFFRSLNIRGIKKTLLLCSLQNNVSFSPLNDAPLFFLQGRLQESDIMKSIKGILNNIE